MPPKGKADTAGYQKFKKDLASKIDKANKELKEIKYKFKVD